MSKKSSQNAHELYKQIHEFPQFYRGKNIELSQKSWFLVRAERNLMAAMATSKHDENTIDI